MRDRFKDLCFVGISLGFIVSFSQVASALSDHQSNYALILSSSRYWFNYRHAANALSLYQFLKRNGKFEDKNIVLMLADEYAVNPRNPFKNRIFTKGRKGGEDLYDEFTEIDYRGDDVTVENLAHAMLGTSVDLPVLNSNENSNILLFWTGHGGDSFFKFQDVEEILAQHLSNIFRQMNAMKKYREILFIADTCQAFTLFDRIEAEQIPNVTGVGSSLRDESSYAHHSDSDLGLSVIERYSYSLKKFLESKSPSDLSHLSLRECLVDPYTFQQQRAHIGIGDAGACRKAEDVPFSDFFFNVERSKEQRDELLDTPALIETTTTLNRLNTSWIESLPRPSSHRSTYAVDEGQPTPGLSVESVDAQDGFRQMALAFLVGAVCAGWFFDRTPIVVRKMQRYNALFDGRPKKLDSTILTVIEDLWDKTSLVIHTPSGEKRDFEAYLQMIESYLRQGMTTELLLLEIHPKGLHYRVQVLLDGKLMTLDSIATVVNGKIVKVEGVQGSDMSTFLDKAS